MSDSGQIRVILRWIQIKDNKEAMWDDEGELIGDEEAELGCVKLKSLRGEAGEQTLALDAIPALVEALG